MYMGMLRRLFNICLLTVLWSPPAMGQEALAPLHFKGQYVFSFARVEFGRMGLEAEQEKDGAKLICDISTTGIVKLFVQHSSHSTLQQTGENGVYESNYKTRKKAKYVKILSRNSKVISEELVPPEAPGKRSAVPADIKKQAHSPLEFLLEMRKNLYNSMKSGVSDYSLFFFDGRRLTQGHFTIEGRKTIRIGEKKYKTIKVAARRTLIGGFTKDEIEEYEPDEPTVYLYYSDDERLIPLRIEFKLGLVTVAATLRTQCEARGECLLDIK